ncbi:hypothetical protein VDG09_07100 [Xanthomonas campestris pv. raphani]|uniref:hypothetical protein n=1 Tax=Xanthomonas campestris TaxID=339 RepID=UPI0023E98B80|nr:hypothetical protein [Xanthomonas campestris]MCW2038200.1 ketosteroid isomerase-like protein [Xanthomonas campestris]MEA9827417.1 hypothetical protein [Xanthomonas campestris pv. raphani]
MSPALPHVIACFLAANNAGDAAVLLPHLADDALVHDERPHRRGAEEGQCEEAHYKA